MNLLSRKLLQNRFSRKALQTLGNQGDYEHLPVPDKPRDQTAALRKLASELSMAEARERRRIAEDLHDHLGQFLALIRMKISAFQSNTIFCGYEQDLIEIQSLMEKAINYTRHLTMAISPPILYQLGLIPALKWLVGEYSRHHGIVMHIRASETVVDVHEEIRGMIYRSVRELLLNIIKHAEASNVELIIDGDQDWMTMTLTDDGKGFDADQVEQGCESGFGLFSIHERLKYLGGFLTISSETGKGTRIIFRCPVKSGESP